MKNLSGVLLFLFFAAPASADTTFVSGTIAGQTWTIAGSPYCVMDSIFVASLTIQPGVRVVFFGNYVFRVSGILTALGQPGDTIVFTRANPTISWNGIKFNNTQPGSMMRYCRVEYSNNSGIQITNSTPLIENCMVFGNSAQSGAGVRILLNAATPLLLTLERCFISENVSTTAAGNCAAGNNGGGGGVMATVTTGRLIIKDSRISGNRAGSSSSYGGRSGGGLQLSGRVDLVRDTIENNSCYSYCCPCAPGSCTVGSSGAGVYVNGNIVIQGCLVRNNLAWAQACFTGSGVATGPGLYFASGTLSMSNTMIAANTAQGNGPGWTNAARSSIIVNAGQVSIVNCAIAYHTNLALHRNGGSVAIKNSILVFNAQGQLSGDSVSVTYSNIEGGFPGTGNIDVNPVFASPIDLRIVSPSLCIDAGDPEPVFNDGCSPPGLGTIRNDMGAHGGPQNCLIVDVQERLPNAPRQFSLSQNYPNPFNPTTTIQFRVPRSEFVTLKIYDLLGREMTTLVNDRKSPGKYSITWNAMGFASGVYLYRIQAGNFHETRRLVLLR